MMSAIADPPGLGAAVGVSVGALVGTAVGVTVGAVLGGAMGVSVGAIVGAAVGAVAVSQLQSNRQFGQLPEQ